MSEINRMRYADADLRLRKDADGQEYLEGLAVPFGKKSRWMGFYEIIERGCQITYPTGGDVRALVNHDSSMILGRVSNGSLELRKGDHGVSVRIRMPDTSYSRDALTLVRDGTIKGMSFGFRVAPGGEYYDAPEQTFHVRAMELREVSILGDPAYLDTNVQVRAMQEQEMAVRQRMSAPPSLWERQLELRRRELQLLEMAAP